MKHFSICMLVAGVLSLCPTLRADGAVEPAVHSTEVTNLKPTQVEEIDFRVEVSGEHGAIIEEIIVTMGSSSVIGLGFKRNHLKALGKKIDGIGSLQFLGYIFSRDDLKKHMANIRRSSMKWNGFMDGVKPGLSKIEASKELYSDLPGFANSLNIDTQPLVKRAEKRDWNGFVSYLIQN